METATTRTLPLDETLLSALADSSRMPVRLRLYQPGVNGPGPLHGQRHERRSHDGQRQHYVVVSVALSSPKLSKGVLLVTVAVLTRLPVVEAATVTTMV